MADDGSKICVLYISILSNDNHSQDLDVHELLNFPVHLNSPPVLRCLCS